MSFKDKIQKRKEIAEVETLSKALGMEVTTVRQSRIPLPFLHVFLGTGLVIASVGLGIPSLSLGLLGLYLITGILLICQT